MPELQKTLYSLPFSAPNFIALIERLACDCGGCRGANWGGLAYVRVIRADNPGLLSWERTSNKFTKWVTHHVRVHVESSCSAKEA